MTDQLFFRAEPLPEILGKKLLLILHRACNEMRALSGSDQQQRLFDLADTVEFIPQMMMHGCSDSLSSARTALETYRKKYPHIGVDYLAMLNMDDAAFDRTYINRPEPDMNDPQMREFIYGRGER